MLFVVVCVGDVCVCGLLGVCVCVVGVELSFWGCVCVLHVWLVGCACL